MATCATKKQTIILLPRFVVVIIIQADYKLSSIIFKEKYKSTNISDEEVKRKVLFYTIYTLIYFPILFGILIWSTGIYIIGKGSFQSILLLIVIAETIKYFACNVYCQRPDKKKDSLAGNFIRLFSWIRLKEGLKTILITGIMATVYFLLLILFGAEVFSKHKESILLSFQLSILSVFPACLNLSRQSFVPLVLGVKPTNKVEALFAQNLYFTLSGAWCGAMTIPLDWDRPWQVWPIPCSLASMVGFLFSHLIMLYRMRDNSRKKHKV